MIGHVDAPNDLGDQGAVAIAIRHDDGALAGSGIVGDPPGVELEVDLLVEFELARLVNNRDRRAGAAMGLLMDPAWKRVSGVTDACRRLRALRSPGPIRSGPR